MRYVGFCRGVPLVVIGFGWYRARSAYVRARLCVRVVEYPDAQRPMAVGVATLQRVSTSLPMLV